MVDSGHRENGRHKADQYKTAQGQWLMQPHPSMKQIMSIIAERDQAIQQRNLALSDKKAAIAERDVAFLQRDTAIAERNNAMMERDNAIAALQYRESSLSSGNMSCPPGCQISHVVKHIHRPQQHHVTLMNEVPSSSRELSTNDSFPITPVVTETSKSRWGRQPKETKGMPSNKKASKRPKKVKMESEDLNKITFDDVNKQRVVSNADWKGQDLGLNQVAFNESTMPTPVCSCTGVLRQCYKWGNGGWQSACCTTNLSMYPLPAVPNKRHTRVGGRKMSGSAFSKLLSRLAAEAYDLLIPVDLKEHWAKHGTNRYITIK